MTMSQIANEYTSDFCLIFTSVFSCFLGRGLLSGCHHYSCATMLMPP